MRVLHYLDELRLEAGGVVRAVLDLAAGLADEGINVSILTGDDTDVPDAWRQGGANGLPSVQTLDRSLTPWLAPKRASDVIAAAVRDADVVHLHTPWDPFNPAVAAAARRAGKPYVVSVHGMLDDWCMAAKALKKRAYLQAVGRRVLEDAAAVHFTAAAERDQAMRWAPRAKPVVTPLLMDLSPYDALPGPEIARERFPLLAATDEPKLLFLSRVDPKKGIDLLIRAVATLHGEGRPTQAVVAGPGEPAYVDSLRSLATSLGVADRVHFVGMVRDEAKWSLYQACDAFVLPTHQENFGIVLVEAIGCGLPTITTKKVDIWSELESHGAVITTDDAESVADGVRSVLADLPAAKAAAQKTRNATLAWLDPVRLRAAYAEMYASVTRG